MEEPFLEKASGKNEERKLFFGKRGQAEIIGLAILVVLLVFILIIALSFGYKPFNESSDIRVSLVANNLLNSLIKENKANIKELIYNCYKEENRNTNNINCQNLDKEINKIIFLSLGKRDYLMRIKTENKEFYKSGSCEKGIESVPYRFKKEGVFFIINLRLC